MLLCDFVRDHYLPFARENKRSWKTDKGNLERNILPHLGAYRLSEISVDVLKNWTNTLALTGLAHSSCFRQFWLAKSVLNCAVRWGMLESDAGFKAANFPAGASRKPVLLESADLVRLLEILRNEPHLASSCAIQLMLLTGASKSEVLYARWEDVDFERRVLSTTRTFTGRPRLIPLNSEALKLLRNLPRRPGVPWLFFTRNGTRLQCITREWYRIREQLGRPDMRLQDLRHSFANLLVSVGVSQSALLAILGHYKPDTLFLVQRSHERRNAHDRPA